jgi:hypothetical protein
MNTIIIILIILIILLIYLKNNKQDNFLNTMFNRRLNRRLNLVFATVGDDTEFDKLWTGNNRNYEIWVIYTGDDDNKYNQYKNIVDRIWKRKGNKFPNFNYIYNNYNSQIMRFNNFYIVDDNIIINTDQINKLFDITNQYFLLISQPAFLPESNITHPITIVQPDKLLRYTNFIELTTPVFSKEGLVNFMKYYDDSLIGWGIDYLYIWANGIDKIATYAIIDKVACIKKTNTDKKDNVAYQAKVWYDYSKKVGVPYDWEIKTYKSIPL